MKIDTQQIENPAETVTVCDKCLQASCWQGIFMCDDSRTAGTVEKTIAELLELSREHPSYWKEARMTTPDIQSLVESTDGAIAFAQSGTSTGGELTHTALNTLATELTRLRAELAEEKRKVEVAKKDKERMDKLEMLFVTVRVPLVYGSREAFMSSPEQGDGEEEPSDIRAQLDILKLK